MTNTDAYFCIGKTHTICQDYAEAGEDLAIISDGCSSAVDSHIGSLLLSRAAKLALKTYDEIPHVFADVQRRITSYAQAMELPQESLLATLGFIKATEKGFSVGLYGDGVVVCRFRSPKTWKYNVMVRDYPSGAPYYPAYQLDKNLDSVYRAKFGTSVTTTLYKLSDEDYQVEYTNTLNPIKDFFSVCFPYEIFDMVAVMSDGATSFQKLVVTDTSKRQKPVHVCEILREALNFKNYNGQFVQRRAKAAFRKFTEEVCNNMDDFSIGVVHRE